MTIWNMMIWGGTALTLIGLAALGWCILTVVRAKRRVTDEETLRKVMQRVMVVNMAALGGSIFGLMFVVLGIMLG